MLEEEKVALSCCDNGSSVGEDGHDLSGPASWIRPIPKPGFPEVKDLVVHAEECPVERPRHRPNQIVYPCCGGAPINHCILWPPLREDQVG